MKAPLQGVIGVAFGVFLLWLALSGVDQAAASKALQQASLTCLSAGVGLFWIAISLRIARWRAILAPVHSLSYAEVALSLIVGYAVNIILPARLGELFRADFVRRRFGLARSMALGSIVIERLFDAVAVMLLFLVGIFAAINEHLDPTLLMVAYGAIGVVVLGLGGVLATTLFGGRLRIARFPGLTARIALMGRTFAGVRGAVMTRSALLTAAIWLMESLAILMMISAFGVAVTIPGLCLVVGTASLSTMLPSAPGYVGSLQLAFISSYAALKIDSIYGFLAASAAQVLLMGSITFVGITLLISDHARNSARQMRAAFRPR